MSLVCWAYDEEDSVREYLEAMDTLLASAVEDYEIVVVDDGSTDRTPAILAEAAGRIPALRILRNATNRNVGFSSRRAIGAATKEFLFWQTIDRSYDLDRLRDHLEWLRRGDVVAGTRRAPGTWRSLFHPASLARRSDTLPKGLVSVANYLLVRALFRVPLSDFQNVCFWPTRLIQSLDLGADSSFANPEALIKAYWRGASIVEVPIRFRPRRAGRAKGTRAKALLASLRDVVGSWWCWVVLGRRGTVRCGRVRRLVPEEWPGALDDLA